VTQAKSAHLPARPLILVIHGPNLNLLGTREPNIYGTTTLRQIDDDLEAQGDRLGVAVQCFQSNHEGAIVDKIQQSHSHVAGLIINAGGLTHTSVSLRDALSAIRVPTIEVHLSNLYAREEFRHRSMLAPVCLGQIAGLGAIGYRLALEAMARLVLEQDFGPRPHRSDSFPAKSQAATSSKKGAARK
jgi:3-dehydroquinate dehydratase-2